MEILNQKATIILAKMETGMDEKINTNRHQMAKERIITETKEIIVHQTTKGKISFGVMSKNIMCLSFLSIE